MIYLNCWINERHARIHPQNPVRYHYTHLKTLFRRFQMGIEMMEDVRCMVEGSIREQNPGISEIDLKIAVFKRYYSKNFIPERFNDIIESMRDYHTIA